VLIRAGACALSARGRERFQVLVGAAVLTNNLMRIAEY